MDQDAATFFDFNVVPSFGSMVSYDLDEVIDRLSQYASQWVPVAFPLGRIEGNELRLADISGRAPKKAGSCSISLKGDRAGCWYDFSTNTGGSPLDTLSYATGLTGRALIEKAVEITHAAPKQEKPNRNGSNGHDKRPFNDIEIRHLVANGRPIEGTIAEVYLKSRGLEIPDCPDLIFNPDATYWETRMSYPVMIARIRGKDGSYNGCIHRTYLSDHGTKADVTKPRSLLGEPNGGAIRLFPLLSDLVGVAEGIETAIAACMLCGVPVWSVLSTSNMMNFQVPEEVRRIIIFADAGEAGENAARKLASRLMPEGIEVEVRLPEFGDDFNDDLIRKFKVDQFPSNIKTQEAPELKVSTGDQVPRPWITQQAFDPISTMRGPTKILLDKIKELPQGTDIDTAKSIISDMAYHEWDSLTLHVALTELRRATGFPIKNIADELSFSRKQLRFKGEQKKTPEWKPLIACNRAGEPKNIVSNAVTILSEDKSWKNILAFDEFAWIVKVVAPPPWEDTDTIQVDGTVKPFEPHNLTDADVLATTVWIQNTGVHVASQLVREAMYHVACEKRFHPVRDYLDNLEWDGKKRLENWLTYYLGAEKGKSGIEKQIKNYFTQIGTAWMVSLVARIYQPGCKADCVLVLEGPQGKRKSTVFSVLGGEWFSDDIKDLFSRESQMQIQGSWIVEIGELDAMRRSEMSSVNAFISRFKDKFRHPYGHAPMTHPRQTIFGGSTNENEWLRDETGGRRWWPVKCGNIDIEALRTDRDQLIAEAVALYRQGAKWWLDDEDTLKVAEEEQLARQSDDAWFEKVATYLELTTEMTVSIGDIMSTALGIDPGKWNKFDQGRVAKMAEKLGWEKFRSNAPGRPNKLRRKT